MIPRDFLAVVDRRTTYLRVEVLPDLRGTMAGADLERALDTVGDLRRRGRMCALKSALRALKTYEKETRYG